MDLNLSQLMIGVNWSNIISNTPGLVNLLNITKAIGIALLVYIIFLIIRSITQIIYAKRFKKLAKNVEEINEKMDLLIGKSKAKKK